MEHHANLVPWQQLCQRTGATLRWFGVTDDGRLDLSDIDELINERTKVVALAHQSNVLGTVNPVARSRRGRTTSARWWCSTPASRCRTCRSTCRTLGVDFLAFSGHKMCGPTGIGVLWGRRELLDAMPPFLTGGSMIEIVRMEGSTFLPPPQRFEAGVPMAAQAVGLAAAVDYLDASRHGPRRRARAGADRDALLAALGRAAGVRILGPDRPGPRRGGVVRRRRHAPARRRAGARRAGIAVRAGHHCAWPLHRRFGVQASTRATFCLYNHPGRDRRPASAALDRVPSALRADGMQLDRCTRRSSWTTTKHPHDKGLREPFDAEVHHVNPTCGDEVTLRVTLPATATAVVADVSYDALGCSISQAARR